MTQRIYIGSDRVTVSKPGFDAVSPPAVDYRYLALDSRLPTGRPLEIGIIPSISVNMIIPFSTTYAGIPAVDLIFTGISALNPSTKAYNQGIVMRDANSSIAYNRTPFYLGIWPHQFTIVDDFQYVRWAALASGQPGFYVVWQNW